MQTLIIIPLLLGGAAAFAAAELAPARAQAAAEDYDTLIASFDAAIDSWKAELKQAEGLKARREVRERHPAKAFWTRFAVSAEAGEGRALLWMAGNLSESGASAEEAAERKPRIYTRLLEHVAADWFGDAIEAIGREKRALGIDGVTGLLEQVVAKAESKELQAHALYRMAKVLMTSKDAAQVALGEQHLIRASEAYEGTRYGALAADDAFAVLHLSPGKVAPDFEARTIDGHEFKLSDYRGKVVLIDFYGFW
jgi:hypothetical protein